MSIQLTATLRRLLPVALALGACTPPEGSIDCENLDETQCLMPFPSDHFRSVDASGRPRLVYGPTSLPESDRGKYVAPAAFDLQGHSIVTPIFFSLPGATLAGVAKADLIDDSLLASSKTVVIDAESGEKVAHWVEFSHPSEDVGQPVIALRLAAALGFQRRYVVAVRGLVDGSNQPVPATRGFRALRDGGSSPVVGIDSRRKHYDEAIFPVLAKAGVARAELQLAWDFTTGSEAEVTGRLLAMRDRLLTVIGSEGPSYEITQVEELADGPIAKIVTGVAQVPSFVLPPDAGGIRRLRLDAGGLPVAEGTEAVEFTLQIPRSALTSATPAAVLQYGHGFLGSKREANNSWLREMADRFNFLILACDMQGMNDPVTVTWIGVLSADLARAPYLSEEPHQGIINHHALVRMLKGRFLTDVDARYTRAGVAMYDPGRIYYYGNSQGGTIGNIVVATSVDLQRGVLGVPGVAFSFLVSRATQWYEFGPLIASGYSKPRDMEAILSLIQLAFERFEPANFIRRVSVDPFPGTPPKQVLLQVAKEDAQVNNDVSALLGRIVGATQLAPAVRPVWGLPSSTEAVQGNAYEEYDFGVAANPRPNAPAPEATDTHGMTRRETVAQDQLWHFLTTGEAVHMCDGVCDPN